MDNVLVAEERDKAKGAKWWIPVVAVIVLVIFLAVIIIIIVLLLRKYRERQTLRRHRQERIEMIDITNGTKNVTSDLQFSQYGSSKDQIINNNSDQ